MTENVNIFTDGGARGNPGPAAIGAVIKTETGRVLHQLSREIGIATNNEAEYLALVAALEYLSQTKNQLSLMSDSVINFFLDSRLVVNQVNGIFKIKNSRMREFLLKVRELEQIIPGKIIYQLIPRERNFEADALVNRALDKI